MKKVTLKLTALVMLLGGTITVSYAQNQINVVTTAVPFLRISPDARSGGMGDVGIATAPDANAAFANIARTKTSSKHLKTLSKQLKMDLPKLRQN